MKKKKLVILLVTLITIFLILIFFYINNRNIFDKKVNDSIVEKNDELNQIDDKELIDEKKNNVNDNKSKEENIKIKTETKEKEENNQNNDKKIESKKEIIKDENNKIEEQSISNETKKETNIKVQEQVSVSNNNSEVNNAEIKKPEKTPEIPKEQVTPKEKNQEEKNNEKRIEMQNKYSVKLAYKNEMGSYQVGWYTPELLMDDNIINIALDEIDKTLSKYPTNFFKEMKDNGMPLTIYVVKNIGGSLSGLTDHQIKSDVILTIKTSDGKYIERLLHHELMHYIDAYLEIKMYPNDVESTMINYNPAGYVYGDTTTNDYVFTGSNGMDAYFIDKYAKTNFKEDRAEIFANLMTSIYAKGYQKAGSKINEKAKLISSQLRTYFFSVKNSTSVRWEQYIYQ